MKATTKHLLIGFIMLVGNLGLAQMQDSLRLNIMNFEEYLGYVKLHHPLIKQANLTLEFGEATLLKARGGFDPKVEVDYDRKKFKNTDYYDILNTTFKIPTWFGVEFKANFEDNTGEYLNPSLKVPEGGLYSAGISLSLAQGLLTNERMASLKKAKFFKKQSLADRQILVNELLYEASLAYFDWLQAYNEEQIFASFLENAAIRLNAITRSVEVGDKAEIDITEARIVLQSRKLDMEAASLKRQKASLMVSNFLWLNEIPLELQPEICPEMPALSSLESSLRIQEFLVQSDEISSLPKMQSLDAKIGRLTADRSLKRNKLLPVIDLQYNLLSSDYEELDSFNTENYKAFLNFSLPLFLRKERGDLKLANLKLQDAQFEQRATAYRMRNKVEAVRFEINSLETQVALVEEIVEDYTTLVSAEDRKFELGESSLFLINSREQKLIDARLKANSLQIKELIATAKLFEALGLAPE